MRILSSALVLFSALSFAACSSDDDPEADAAVSADGGIAADGGGSVDANDPSDADLPDISGLPDAGGNPGDSGVVLGEPIEAPVDTWTWVDFPESACNDGSPTGIGVRTSSTSSNVLLFFNGGGACWDFLTCFTLGTATLGPIGATEFNRISGQINAGVFDRANPDNIFADWNLVFIPYCTGDTHAGDNVINYDPNGQASGMFHHVGRKNFNAFVQRLAATFPSPGKLVVSGASAGGFGAAWNYNTVRTYWPTGQVYLIDDSGPALKSNAISPTLRDAWLTSWNLGPLLDDICGAECADDFSVAYTKAGEKFPNDRKALLSSLQDDVIRSFMMLSPQAFQAALLEMSAEVIDPQANFKYFFVTGSSHTMLGDPQNYTVHGLNLLPWMEQMVTDDPAWSSHQP